MELEGELPVLRQQCGSKANSNTTSYMCDHVGMRRVKARQRTIRLGIWKRINKFAKEAFLPQGYPDSVSGDYIDYQVWDTLQSFCSCITGMLSTLALLKGVGVGDSTATPLAATITWMVKDGTGMIAMILFSWVQGIDLDCNAKRWRLTADVLNDVALFLELLAPLFPHLFLLILCVASISRAVVGSAGVATRAALVQHQARRDNMADVAAKDNSQEKLVNLVGLFVNLWVSRLVAGRPVLVWSLFVVFTMLHLISNHRAVSVVCMETFNKNRFHIVMTDYLSSGYVPGPASVNSREPIVARSTRLLSYTLGAHVTSAISNTPEYKAAVQKHKGGHRYILRYQHWRKNVMVALHSDSSPRDQLRAAVTVEILDYIIAGYSLSGTMLEKFTYDIQQLKAKGDGGSVLAEYVNDEVCSYLFPSLLSAFSQAGWLTDSNLLAAQEWRYSWSHSHEYH